MVQTSHHSTKSRGVDARTGSVRSDALQEQPSQGHLVATEQMDFLDLTVVVVRYVLLISLTNLLNYESSLHQIKVCLCGSVCLVATFLIDCFLSKNLIQTSPERK